MAEGPAGGRLSAAEVDAVRAGYAFDAPALELGVLVDGEPRPDVPVRVPLAMVTRHGLVAGATGTGKTTTLQLLAEQLSAAGVPVFAPDVKGDLSGVALPGSAGEKLLARTRSTGQDWTPAATPTEFLTLGGLGAGIPVRASVERFGPLLLGKVLGLNPTQESSLALVFHYAARSGLRLVDLGYLRSVLAHLVSAEGKRELAELGGLSPATAGVILRELVTFADGGADAFFGEPSFDPADVLRVDADGRGVVSLLELSSVQREPELFSTFLMWLLAELSRALPEAGDVPRPRLVFFFDEAHLLFRDASKDFLALVTQTVRLIRSKGVGIFFVTQSPKDLPGDVLAQLGSRVQHQVRAHTPDDARALKATVATYPRSGYDLAEVLAALPTGDAVVTVLSEEGAPTPVAWTRVRAPRGSMSPAPADAVAAAVRSSPLRARYGDPVDPESARDVLAARAAASAAAPASGRAPAPAADPAPRRAPARKPASPRGSTRRGRRRSWLGRLVERIFGRVG